MAMSRSDAVTYVAGMYAQLLSDAGLATTDTAGALKEVIDRALLWTGTTYADLATATVADADALGFMAVLDYAVLLRIDGARGDRATSLSAGGTSVSFNRSGWSDRLKAAKDAAAPYMDTGEWGSGVIVFDYQEPVRLPT